MTIGSNNWESLTLGDLGKWVTGSTPPSSDLASRGEEVLFVTPTDIGYGGKLGAVSRRISNAGADRVRRIRPGSVILVCIGTIGKVAWTDQEITTNQQINALEVDIARHDFKFIHWLLASPQIQEQLWTNSTSTTVALLNKRTLEKIPIQVPPIEEQKRIVEALDSYLEKIDLTVSELHSDLRKLDELERSARFSEFERANTANANSIVQLKDVTVKAKSIDPKVLGVHSFKYVDISSISTDLESPQILGSTETSKAPSRARQQIMEGDIVFSTVRPYQKKIALIKADLNGHIASTGFCVLRPIGDLVDSRYLYHYLKSDMLLDQVLPLQRGASYPAVGDTDVKQSTMPLPDLAKQQEIASNLDVVVGAVKVLKSQLETTIERAQVLRRALLHKAFLGQLNKEK
jgi:type I restriction enzyme S subunit